MSERHSFTSGFILGTMVGGIFGGIAGTIVAHHLNKETEDIDNSAVLEEEKATKQKKITQKNNHKMESTLRNLENQIAQANSAIDEVRQSLLTENGN